MLAGGAGTHMITRADRQTVEVARCGVDPGRDPGRVIFVLDAPPSSTDGECTEKGYQNQRVMRERRREAIACVVGSEGMF